MVENISLLTGLSNNITNQKSIQSVPNASTPFSDVLNNALKQVDEDLKTASVLSNKVATGNVTDLHQVMIGLEKANLGLQLTVQVRNKAVEAYQEIMRIQV
ncbi:flagellar hook-basal body complex protein FliE [Tepidibacillus infernus]|uniref:Flagellar hook-basal body complex protein FliE n=1 Tax=Tepidibacillus decaturensis TaxID=1413211 RepID=A0A135L329_9BACI|nr:MULTISPECIES: flagellar hook-basal body complex protein FliE [Tepidibacillus]KXG43382.1 hypothetical protein U473_04660 [Tepidibacillus decaturensis]GBF11597.1 flagellar hook-basal body complex protein FliE [Tepidibacillus sp. HK-1]